MLRSYRLLASEPQWKHLFVVERPAELDFTRCFKDQSDPFRSLLTLKEAASTEFQSMTDSHMLKTLSVLGYLQYHAMRLRKEIKLIDVFWTHAKGRLDAGQINWTPNNISSLCEFITNSPAIATSHLPPASLHPVYSAAMHSSALRLAHLAYVVSSCFHYPGFYSQAHLRLVERFNATTDFGSLSSNDLRTLCKSLFMRPNGTSESPVSASLFHPDSLKSLQTTVISRLNKGQLDIVHVLDIMEAFHKLTDQQESLFNDIIVDWVLRLLDPEEELHMDSIDQDPRRIVELVEHLVPGEPLSKLIFRLAANRLFLKFLMAKGSHTMTMRRGQRLEVLKMYLKVAARNRIFQVVFLDQTIETLTTHCSPAGHFYCSFSAIASIVTSLAELNYAARFALLHTDRLKKNWENFKLHIETTTLKRVLATSEAENGEEAEDLRDEEDLEDGKEALNVLWALAVLDWYSVPMITAILKEEKVQIDAKYTDEEMSKLAQVQIWLEREKAGEFSLSPKLKERIAAYKSQKDANSPLPRPYSELRHSIQLYLSSQGLQPVQNFSDFPYLLSFAGVPGQKDCIETEENCYLEGSEGQVLQGAAAIQRRQLQALGWKVRWESLQSWLSRIHS